MYHNPVLLAEAVAGLNIQPDGIYVDVTFGGGGHSAAILDQLDNGKLFAFDQDADARMNAIPDSRFRLIPENFRNLSASLNGLGVNSIDGLLADLGVSSHQFDEAARGFSIRFDADLDMRMDQTQTLTARDVVNYYPEEALSKIFRDYSELPQARRIAAAIATSRKVEFINTSDQLKAVTGKYAPRAKEKTFYAQLFQGLRIEVNDELAALRELLIQAANLLRSGGRLVVISYHSLEDRLVKNFIQSGNFEGELHKDIFGHTQGLYFRQLHRKPIEAGEAELLENPRSRSAKMRIAEKI